MRILVAGGAGFIGSHVAQRLAGGGNEIVAVDNLRTGSRANLPHGIPLTVADCASDAYRSACGGSWDLVVHFAGASSAPLFDERPARAWRAVAAFQNSLETARRSGCRVLYASTSSLYARSPQPSTERSEVVPGTLYEFSKLAMEQMATTYRLRHGVDSLAFRLFSVYGPGEEAKGRFANVVSQFLWEMRAGRRPVVYGDGRQTRDFVHVDDVVEAMVVGLRGTRGSGLYNVGTGASHSFNEVVSLLNKALGTDLKPRHVPNPIANYVAATLADATRLRSLGWHPKVTLAGGIKRLVESPGSAAGTIATPAAA